MARKSQNQVFVENFTGKYLGGEIPFFPSIDDQIAPIASRKDEERWQSRDHKTKRKGFQIRPALFFLHSFGDYIAPVLYDPFSEI